MKTQLFVRRPLEVEAIQVSKENIYDVAKWCHGRVRRDRNDVKYVKVRVLNSHADMLDEADIGCWILKSERGFKVYTDQAFENSFIPVDDKEYGKVRIVTEAST